LTRRSKASESHIWRHFYDVTKITSPKMRYQNDVTRYFYFQAPPLVKSWLRSCHVVQFYCRCSAREEWICAGTFAPTNWGIV